MKAEEINKKIQAEKDSHANEINRLQKEICKQNERHQRNMQYWRNKKEQIKNSKQSENFDVFINNIDNLLEQALDD